MTDLIAKPARMSEKLWRDVIQILRYRVLSVALLTALSEPGSAAGALERLTRAVKSNWLRSTRLQDNEPFFAFGPKSYRYFGVHHFPGFPFGNDGLLQHVGIATFCAATGFQRMLPGEFQRSFSDCQRPGLPAHSYCLDLQDPTRLVWTIVDHGASTFRFHHKASKVIAKRLELPGFQRLLAERRFRIVVLTATPEKASRIEKSIAERPPLAATCSAVCLPNLSQFFLKF